VDFLLASCSLNIGNLGTLCQLDSGNSRLAIDVPDHVQKESTHVAHSPHIRFHRVVSWCVAVAIQTPEKCDMSEAGVPLSIYEGLPVNSSLERLLTHLSQGPFKDI
jgi:hypothetical protein